MNRNLLIAAVVSAGAHAALLLPLLSSRLSAPAVPPEAVGAEWVQVEVSKREDPQPAPSPKAEGARRAAVGSRHPLVVTPKRREPEATEVGDAPAAGADVPAAVPGSPSTSPSSSVALAAAEPPAAAPASDPSVERELHQRLQASAARCYPSASRRFHEQGVTEVSFCVGDGGQLAEGKLARSSGSERLDRAALDCVLGGSDPFPAAHGRCFALPVRFGD